MLPDHNREIEIELGAEEKTLCPQECSKTHEEQSVFKLPYAKDFDLQRFHDNFDFQLQENRKIRFQGFCFLLLLLGKKKKKNRKTRADLSMFVVCNTSAQTILGPDLFWCY